MTHILSRRTPLDAEYETCEYTKVSLFVYPGDVSPHDVSLMLGIEPSKVHVRGEEVTGKLFGRTRVIKVNGWFLESEGKVASLDVRHHLDWLLPPLFRKKKELLQLQSVPGLKMGINCIWYSRFGHGGPTLWPEQMLTLAELNLECSFDVYFHADEA